MADGKDPPHTGTRKNMGPCAPTGPKSLLAIWSRSTGHSWARCPNCQSAHPARSRTGCATRLQGHREPHFTPQKPPQCPQPDSQPLRLGDELPAQPALRSQPHATPHRPGAPTLTGTPQLRPACRPWRPPLPFSQPLSAVATGLGVAAGSVHTGLRLASSASGVPSGLAQAGHSKSPMTGPVSPGQTTSIPVCTFHEKQQLLSKIYKHLFWRGWLRARPGKLREKATRCWVPPHGAPPSLVQGYHACRGNPGAGPDLSWH